MSTQLHALASQIAGLPLVRDVAETASDPSALAVILTACAAMVAGRLIGIGPRTPHED
ncbi:MAG: hypothetical protein MK010_10150 [Erythrobacter sp.]|nr:hypothetical protein [Erythrobacter sp.]